MDEVSPWPAARSDSEGCADGGRRNAPTVVVSYSLFIRFLRGEGQEAFRLRNELELAHGIQKTLVPPVSMRTAITNCMEGLTRVRKWEATWLMR